MTPDQLSHLPPWATRLIWSVVVLLIAYLVGRIAGRTVCQRLSVWVSRTAWQWDDAIVEALRRGIPLWSLLAGCYIAIGFWQLPAHLHDIASKVLSTLMWLSATMITAGLATKLFVLYGGHPQQAMPMTSLTQNVTKIAIVVLGLLMILSGLGISVVPILTALGVGGLAVALALQDTLSNLFAGIYLTMARQVRVGDYVKLESGQEGYVEDIGWRTTKIRMPANNTVLVPNNKLSQSIITNYYLPSRDLAFAVQVGVDYQSDLHHVERVTTEVAREVMRTVPGGVPEFEPVVRFHAFGDFSIDFMVILRGKEVVDQDLIRHELIKRLHARYEKERITIPFPIRTVHVKQLT